MSFIQLHHIHIHTNTHDQQKVYYLALSQKRKRIDRLHAEKSMNGIPFALITHIASYYDSIFHFIRTVLLPFRFFTPLRIRTYFFLSFHLCWYYVMRLLPKYWCFQWMFEFSLFFDRIDFLLSVRIIIVLFLITKKCFSILLLFCISVDLSFHSYVVWIRFCIFYSYKYNTKMTHLPSNILEG